MHIVTYMYITWLFTSNLIISAFPSVDFLAYYDEFFLVIGIVYVMFHYRKSPVTKHFYMLLLALIIFFGLSMIINGSPMMNLLLLLNAYLKPLIFGLVVIMLVRTSGMLVYFTLAFILIQIPIALFQSLTPDRTLDDVVGTFGPLNSLNLGYLFGLIVAYLLPTAVFEVEKRIVYSILSLGLLLVIFLTGTKQVFVVLGATILVLLLITSKKRLTVIKVTTAVALFFFLIIQVSAPNLEDLRTTVDMLWDYEESRKFEGIAVTYALFQENPLYVLFGTGPGMYSSFVALKSETEFARLVNYAYYLQQEGEPEEGLGGTFSTASSSLLALVGESGVVGFFLFVLLLCWPYRRIKSLTSRRSFRFASLSMTLFLLLCLPLQNILEHSTAIHFFWGLNFYLGVRAHSNVT